MLGVHRNKVNKLLPKLIERGEVVEDETGIYSPRAIKENQRAFGKATGGVTQGVTRGVTRGVTPRVEGEKTQQILRATLDKIRIRKKDSPKSPHGDLGEFDDLPGQLDIIDDTPLAAEAPPPKPAPKPKQLPDDFVQARAKWNEYAAKSGATRSMTPNPAPKLVKQVVEAVAKVGGQDNFALMCEYVAENPFYSGQNDRGWKADLEFVSRPTKVDSLFDRAMEAKQSPPIVRRVQTAPATGDRSPGLLASLYGGKLP
jgi:hypothetical protein